MMFLNQAIVSRALQLLLLGSACLVAVNAQTNDECDFSDPDALTNIFGRSIPRSTIQVPSDSGVFPGTIDRTYFTYVPQNLSCRNKEVPLVLDVHARGNCPSSSVQYTGWFQKAESECFVLVYPNAFIDDSSFRQSCFNMPGGAKLPDTLKDKNDVVTFPCCCEDANTGQPVFTEEPNDVLFLKMAIDEVVRSFNELPNLETNKGLTIDANRVYMAGHSNGCISSFGVAALYSDTIAAVCCHAGWPATPFPPSYSPVPLWTVYGLKDTLVPKEGFFEEIPLGNFGLWTLDQNIRNLLDKNGCERDSQNEISEDGTIYKGLNCKVDTEIMVLNDSGHFIFLSEFFPPGYGGSRTTIDTTQSAWEFCSAQALTDRPTEPLTYSPTESPIMSSTASPTVKVGKTKKTKAPTTKASKKNNT